MLAPRITMRATLVRADLADARHVLLTGAAGAIGGALARELAKAAPAAHFSLVDKNPVAHDLGERARVLHWDLANPAALESAYTELLEPVDVLVNCAGFMLSLIHI